MPRYILPLIVLAQFCCTSVWFAGNAVMEELLRTYALPVSTLGRRIGGKPSGDFERCLILTFPTNPWKATDFIILESIGPTAITNGAG